MTAHDQSTRASTTINKCEIRIIGLQRTGNHAIINWIISQTPGRTFFLSDVRASENPYASMSEFEHYESGSLVTRLTFWEPPAAPIDELCQHGYGREVAGSFSAKQLLIYNYEDQPLTRICSDYCEQNHDKWLGISHTRFDVLIVRDPFNLLASRLRMGSALSGIKDYDRVKVLWKEYAREYLSMTRVLGGRPILVNFNEWFLSRTYRCELARTLNLVFSDAGVDHVAGFGGGSSFDGFAFQGRAREMRILERWKAFADDDDYKALLGDGEMLDMSRAIFGHVAGTEMLAPR